MQEKYSRLEGALPHQSEVHENTENRTPRLSTDDLTDHFSFANAITKYNMEPRMFGAYGGWQAFPSEVGKEINGFDERFSLYGGEHHEIRNRLINKGLKEKRLQGDPLLVHQTHQSWVEADGAQEDKIEEEQKKHNKIIEELSKGNRVKANTGKKWGEA